MESGQSSVRIPYSIFDGMELRAVLELCREFNVEEIHSGSMAVKFGAHAADRLAEAREAAVTKRVTDRSPGEPSERELMYAASGQAPSEE